MVSCTLFTGSWGAAGKETPGYLGREAIFFLPYWVGGLYSTLHKSCWAGCGGRSSDSRDGNQWLCLMKTLLPLVTALHLLFPLPFWALF